ncbi:hypothetical protein ACFO5K_07325 [Nocardia halotolerans]|uniref:LppU protein n=1 Tax=Nocardia halotolerans TaxID=1755878 RepID=A0ABV8VE69_9NOCA
MFADLPVGRFVGALAITVTALVSSGCGNTIGGQAKPAVDVVPATSSAAPTTTASETTSRAPAPASQRGGISVFDATIGDCVAVAGTTDEATIEQASCGSRASNFKVIGKGLRSTDCVSDRDNYFVETLDGIETGALCLDVDWVVGGCMDIAEDIPTRIDCAESAVKPVKVVSVENDTATVDSCPDDADTGFEKHERRFVVCVASL